MTSVFESHRCNPLPPPAGTMRSWWPVVGTLSSSPPTPSSWWRSASASRNPRGWVSLWGWTNGTGPVGARPGPRDLTTGPGPGHWALRGSIPRHERTMTRLALLLGLLVFPAACLGRSAGARRSARPRGGPCARRCRRSSRGSAVELRPEESRRGPQDLVGPAELAVLALERLQALTPFRGEPGASPAVDLGLADPLAEVSGPMSNCRAIRVKWPWRSPVASIASNTSPTAQSFT
jgi:hypothetical protein